MGVSPSFDPNDASAELTADILSVCREYAQHQRASHPLPSRWELCRLIARLEDERNFLLGALSEQEKE